MSSTMGCRHCRGLCAGAASRCHNCGKWIRKQDYYSTTTEPEGSVQPDGRMSEHTRHLVDSRR